MISRYPRSALVSDYVRAALGALACALPLAVDGVPPVVAVLCAAGIGLFAAYALGTRARQRLRLRVDGRGIAFASGDGALLPWSAIERLRLAYYSVRRDGRDGWMELRLEGAGRRVRVDSRIEGFETIAERAARGARERGLDLDPVTLANLAMLRVVPASGPALVRDAAP